MKEAGIDGLSWGDFMEGMMTQGSNPLSFILFNLGANNRSPSLPSEWVKTWWVDPEGNSWGNAPLITLTPSDWFTLLMINGPRFWIPPLRPQ
jgi:hypothetical protein